MALSLEEMKANRRRWVEALRSGKYKQAKHVLRNGDNGMCCLGVLAEIAGCDWKRGDGWFADGEGQTAPKRAKAFVGLRENNGGWKDDQCLSDQNDRGKTFSEIADIIESEPDGLFIDPAESA